MSDMPEHILVDDDDVVFDSCPLGIGCAGKPGECEECGLLLTEYVPRAAMTDRVAELEEQFLSARRRGHDMALDGYRHYIAELEARVKGLELSLISEVNAEAKRLGLE
ncbi:MAG: hypothetical protein QM523_01125 [Candidatus Pacebacteria bacterium]|nr:hypothetical protein [Candidatus Paceibacterota bacterium]